MENYFLEEVQDYKKILIVGGGTGEILKEFTKLNFQNTIYFLEWSGGMIRQAQKNAIGLDIYFIHEKEDLFTERGFDCILTPYFLDQFEGSELKGVLNRLYNRLDEGGLLLVTDFDNNNAGRTPAIVKVMYLFFKFTTGIKADKLIVFEILSFLDTFEKLKERKKGNIKTVLFRKK